MGGVYIRCAKAHPPPPRCSQGALRIHFQLNFGLPGSAGSVPTVLHDATDTGTDYILKHLILVGPKGGKMMPREPKKFGLAQGCQNDTHGIQN